jgi:acetolactate synthase-1/2/3 large subunit
MKWQTGASRVVEALQQGGVRCVFGLPGTQMVELFEALRQSGLRTVIATNELSAAFMAGGWARVTGEPGVLLTISGPGFTWALTGIAEARLDSVPLLHITGTPSAAPNGRHVRQQELAQASIAAPLVKGVIEADLYSDPGAAVFDALLLARSGEPGPVLLQVSSTTLRRELGDTPPGIASSSLVEAERFAEVCARLSGARRPIFIAGQGTHRYADHLRALVDRVNAPLLTTPSARGVLPEDHPLNFGFDPFAGSVRDVNELLESSDLVLAIGCKLGHSDTNGFEFRLPADRLVHLDASADVIGANYPASLGVVGDAGALMEALLSSEPPTSAWTKHELATWRVRVTAPNSGSPEPRIAGTRLGDARSFFESLRRVLAPDAILVLDSGLHQILARRYYRVLAPFGLIMPTDLQSMGFAIPTAIGARMAMPNRAVLALVGDGGFTMTALELLSAAREGIALVVIVFVDGAFGQIRMQQLASYGISHGVLLQNPDISLLAAAVGARHEIVADGEVGVERIVRAALEYSGVTVIEVAVGDSVAIRRTAAVARAREGARRIAGPRVVRFLTKLLRKAR